jgi:hypothetical protein
MPRRKAKKERVQDAEEIGEMLSSALGIRLVPLESPKKVLEHLEEPVLSEQDRDRAKRLLDSRFNQFSEFLELFLKLSKEQQTEINAVRKAQGTDAAIAASREMLKK